MNRRILLAICFLTSSCGRDNDEAKLLQFDREITIVTRISSSGGALGEEIYRLSYRYKGEEKIFFEGMNPKDFNLKKAGPNKIAVRFCDGTVSLAQPIFPGPLYKELIHLDLNLAC